MTITPDQMKAIVAKADRVKRALDGEPLEEVYHHCLDLQVLGSHQEYIIAKADEERDEMTRFAIDFLAGPTRGEWAKVVREGIDLYELGEMRQAAWSRGDSRDQIRFESEREEINASLTSLAAILTAGLEGTT